MESKFLTYRGEVRALLALGGTVAFVTVHPEGQPTALYRLDADKLQLKADPLPCGGVGLAAGPDGGWVLGTEGKVHPFAIAAKDVSSPPANGAIALLSGDRLAVIAGNAVLV